MDPSERHANQPHPDPSSASPRAASYRPQRARWPGLIGAAVIVAAVVALLAWSHHDGSRRALRSSEGAAAQSQRQEAPGDSVNRDLALTDSATAAIAVAPVKQ